MDNNYWINVLIKAITGIAGGASMVALFLLWEEDKVIATKLSKRKAVIIIFFGVIGSFYFAPFVVEYFKLEGGAATLAGFLCAFTFMIIVQIIVIAVNTIKDESGNIVKRKLKKWLGDEKPNNEN